MIYPFADKLENLGSKYALVIVTAKRAKQLKSGVQPSIATSSRNPLTIALEEISQGKIKYSVPDNDLIIAKNEELEVAQLLAIPRLADEEEETQTAAVVEEETMLRIEDEIIDEEGLEEWEDNEEDEVLPLDVHLEKGIIIVSDEDEDSEDVTMIVEEEPKPKAKRGRKAAQPEPEPKPEPAAIEDLDIDIDIDIDVDEIDLDADVIEDEE